MELKIDFNAHKAKTWLNAVERDQIPYATSVALNQTAFRAQKAVQGSLKKNFILRNRWTERGILVSKSHKTNLVAIVGTRDKYLADHEYGGKRKRESGHSNIIPVGIRKSKRQRITKSKYPGVVLKKKNVFLADTKRGNQAIFKKVGGKKNGRSELLYLLYKKPVQLKSRLNMRETVSVSARRGFPRNFQKAFEMAIRTAK